VVPQEELAPGTATTISTGGVLPRGADGNVFLGLPCFLHDPMDVGNLTSGSSNQFVYLEVLSSCTVETHLEGY